MQNSQKIFHLKPDSTPNAHNKKDLSAYYSKEVCCVILNSFVFLMAFFTHFFKIAVHLLFLFTLNIIRGFDDN